MKIFGSPIVVPDVTTTPASNLALSSATLNGTVNPDNEGNATCQFEWGPTKAFGHTASCSEEVPDGNAPVTVHADISGLEKDTEYCFRLQASNKNGTNQGEASQDQCFKTTGPGLHGQSVSSVTAESATLHAKIDPNNAPTTFYFQYGTSTAYGTNIPAPPGASIGEGEGDVDVSPQHIQGLQSHTVYHYRVVAISELSPGVFEEFDGPDQSFTTQLSGAELVLPDDRSWSSSPRWTSTVRCLPIGEDWVIQAAANGQAITYVANGPLGSEPQGNSRRPQILSTRSRGRLGIAPHRAPACRSDWRGGRRRAGLPLLLRGPLPCRRRTGRRLPTARRHPPP